MLCIHVANLLELLTLYLAKFDEVVNSKAVSLVIRFRTVDYLHWTNVYSSSYNCFPAATCKNGNFNLSLSMMFPSPNLPNFMYHSTLICQYIRHFAPLGKGIVLSKNKILHGHDRNMAALGWKKQHLLLRKEAKHEVSPSSSSIICRPLASWIPQLRLASTPSVTILLLPLYN